MTKSTRYFMTGSAAVLGIGLCTGLVAYYGGGFQALVASTGPSEMAYVPADASVVAYADVRSIMDSELRQRFKQAIPGPMHERGQQELLENTGINLENDVDYVVAAVSAGGPIDKSGVLIARGRFDAFRLENLAVEHGGQAQEYRGKRIVVIDHAGTHEKRPSLAFLEPGLVALGDLNSIQRSIDAQMSAQSITGNDEMMNLVKDIVRNNNAWAVGRFDLIASQAKLPAEIARQIPPVKWFAAAGHINGGVSAQLRAEANDDQAAENLRGVVNGVVSLARLQGQKDPKLDALINSFQMSGSGKTVDLTFTIPAEIFELMAPKVQPQVQ